MQQSRTTPSQHQGYLPLPAYTDSTPSLVSESPDDSFDSNSSETGAAVPPSAPNVRNLKQKRHSGRAWFLATSVSTVLAMMLLMQHVDGLAAIRQALASTPLVSSTAQCPDPYAQPGFLWRSTNRTMARWIPFDTASHLERDDSVDFRTVGGRFSVDDVPDQALALAPPSLSLAMLARKEARQRSADLEGVDALDFVRGKKVAIAGCSLDRNAMASMCKTLGLGESELTIDLHGYSSCHFRDLDFTVEIWFHGGVREHYRVDGKDYTFEEKMESDYLPRVRASGRAPHYIILASGTWDQRSLSAIFQPTEDVSASKQHQAPKDKLVPLLPLQAYAYYQTRLRDMVRFLRAEFPDAGLMFRPETYQNKNTNALVYNIREAAIAAMRSVQVPIFLWAEKLIGEQDMYDAIHYREGSAANWLWSDMLLHYLRHYSEGTNSCYLS